MQTWLLLAFGATGADAIQRILRKLLASDKNVDLVVMSSFFPIIAGILLLLYAILSGQYIAPTISGIEINWILMIGLYAAAGFLGNLALRHADVSEIAPISASGTAWTVISSAIFLHEQITIQKILATVVIIIGVYIMYDKSGGFKMNKGHLIGMVSAMCFGLAFTNDIMIVNESPNIVSYVPYAYLLPGIFTIMIKPKATSNIKRTLRSKNLIFLLTLSFIAGVGFLLKFSSYGAGGEASVISIIFRGSLVISAIISFVLLKERSRISNKIFGTLLILAGVVIIL